MRFKLKTFFILTTLLSTSTAFADNNIIIGEEIKHDISKPLREMPASASMLAPSLTTMPLFHPPALVKHTKKVLNTIFKKDDPTDYLIPLDGFQGIGKGLGNYQVRSVPADANGAPGMNQYVQWVNTDFAVFDKATGEVASGFPKPGNSIWSGFGGVCEYTNIGSPIVKYDQLAHRWVLTQMAFFDMNSGPFVQCVAVSTSEDATGSYYRYAFHMGSLNDSPKLGVWPDGYYMTFNMFGPLEYGPRACALERDKMLNGRSAKILCSQLRFNQSGSLLPADLDGQMMPPPGNPEYFLSMREPDELLLFKFNVDFDYPHRSSFSGPTVIPVMPFTPACPNTQGDACAVQPNTLNRLDTLSDRLMYRLAYRQFSDHASMVVNHTIEGPMPKQSPSVRWYELRFPTGSTTPSVYQQGTNAPDSKNRFMGSIAMDKFGNIAVGYTVSSTAVHPSPEFQWRLVTDPLNAMHMLQPLFTGTGSQINGVTRWGSYSSMAIDPVDDCTFWYTSEYLLETGSFNWSTHVIHFNLGNCSMIQRH